MLERLDLREREELCCFDSSVSRLYTHSAFRDGGREEEREGGREREGGEGRGGEGVRGGRR